MSTPNQDQDPFGSSHQNPYSAQGPYPPPGQGPQFGQGQYYGPGPYPNVGYGFQAPNSPYGIDPVSGRPYSEKSKVVAGVLQLCLGGLGVGRFYTGHVGIGIAQLLTCGGLGIWSLIDAIMMFMGNVDDADGRPLRN
ncbi:TM2 domain-containing protein [Buchananella hordeovulneris]|uniref:TM2 domain-containing protein n=1 Tax=Buchananella hordeovulneris TaxID=52770 RepID=UPI0026DDC586|nr:TM2 domain-containing protein [Buchananella hordeovulneris]MDO5081761.1 TM2 domain-containing protein [Buchananella hordeovulneris]